MDRLDRYAAFPDLRFDRPAAHVLRIAINRPERRNALHAALHDQLHAIWQAIDADPETRVTIITGVGSAFCAGGDFAEMPNGEPPDPEVVFCDNFRAARELVAALINCSKPIVSAINGPAVGAGLAIALLADISIAANSAKLLDGHLRIGVVPGDHAAIVWPLLCGLAKAKLHLMTNRPLTGADAARCNLVSMAVDGDQLAETALQIAVDLANTAPTALRMTKYVLNHWLREKQAIFDLSAALEMVNFTGADAQEAMRASAARETPNFVGSARFA